MCGVLICIFGKLKGGKKRMPAIAPCQVVYAPNKSQVSSSHYHTPGARSTDQMNATKGILNKQMQVRCLPSTMNRRTMRVNSADYPMIGRKRISSWDPLQALVRVPLQAAVQRPLHFTGYQSEESSKKPYYHSSSNMCTIVTEHNRSSKQLQESQDELNEENYYSLIHDLK